MITIARFTLLKIFEPAFIFLLLFGLCISYMTSESINFDLEFFNNITNSQESINMDIGCFILVMLSVIIAVFVGSTEIPRDLNTRMITILLSKPISRAKYVAGRLLGTWLLSSSLYVIWMLGLGILQYMNMPDIFSFKNFGLNLLYIFSLAPVSAIAVTISTYLDDVPAMIISFMIISLSFTMGTIPIIVKAFSGNDLGKMLLLFYYMLPNFAYLFKSFESFIQGTAYLLYSVTMSLIIMKIGIMHFQERDLI